MTRPHVTVGDHLASAITVHVPGRGPWWADVVFEGDPDVSGQVTIRIGDLELIGTIDPDRTGTRGLQRRCRVVAGAGGWGTLVSPRHFHNDAGVQARTVALAAAAAAGEQLGDFAPEVARIGVDYMLESGAASRVLEDVIGAVPWWVDYAGVTQVGQRATSTPAAGSYEILDYEADARVVELAMDDLRSVVVGSVLVEDLDEPQTVHALELQVSAEQVRVRAWCGGELGGHGRIARALRQIVRRLTDGQLFGLYRYRVVEMTVDRVNLQIVHRRSGLPDLVQALSMWPGVAGAHGDLTPGAEVLVQFIEGDRTMPIITAFAGKDGVGWSPVTLTLDAELIRLGKDATKAVALAEDVDARLGDLQAAHDGHKHGGVTTGGGTSAVPDLIVGPLAPTGATKARAE